MKRKILSFVRTAISLISMFFIVLSFASCSKEEVIRPDISDKMAINVGQFIQMEFTVHAGDILESRLPSDGRGLFFANQADAITLNSNNGVASAYMIWVKPELYRAWKDRWENGIHIDPLPRPIKTM